MNFKQPCHPYDLLPLYNHIHGAKTFYTTLNQEKHNTALKAKWQSDLEIRIDEETWQLVFNITFKVISDNHLIWLQYRLLHCILGTRGLLFKIGKSNLTQKVVDYVTQPQNYFYTCSVCAPKVYIFGNSLTFGYKTRQNPTSTAVHWRSYYTDDQYSPSEYQYTSDVLTQTMAT